MENLNIESLTAEQKKQLLAQLEKDAQAEEKRKRDEKKVYENMRDKTVKSVFKQLEKLSATILTSKQNCFDNFETILALKRDLYRLDSERWEAQQSHTFTTDDGAMSIIIGHNVIDRWDDTVSEGIELVNRFLTTLARDKESAALVDMVRDLLKPNREGQLKANRVLELAKRADEIGNADLKEGVRIIRDAYRPSKTSTFLKAKYKDDLGRDQWLPLSMSAV